MKPTIILIAFTAVASCMRAPPVCLSNILELDAGVSFVSASIDGSFAGRCEASVTFDDPEFLPVTYTFDASHCDGSFLASFQVPPGFSTGLGYIFWQCSGASPSCNRIRVNGGQKDPSLALQMQGSVQCAAKYTSTPSMAMSTGHSSTTLSGASMATSGGNVFSSNDDAIPTQSALPTYGTSSVTTSSTGRWPTGTSNAALWPTGAKYTGDVNGAVTGAVTGAPSNSQRSTSTTPAVNDASAINARQTAITSTIFTTILLTQTITSIATVC